MSKIKKLLASMTAFATVLTSVPFAFAMDPEGDVQPEDDNVPELTADLTISHDQDLPEFVNGDEIVISNVYNEAVEGDEPLVGLRDGWRIDVSVAGPEGMVLLDSLTNEDQDENGDFVFFVENDVYGQLDATIYDPEGDTYDKEELEVFTPFGLSIDNFFPEQGDEMVVTLEYDNVIGTVEMYHPEEVVLLVNYLGVDGDELNETDYLYNIEGEENTIIPDEENNGKFRFNLFGEAGVYEVRWLDLDRDLDAAVQFDLFDEVKVEEENNGGGRRRPPQNDDDDEVVEEENNGGGGNGGEVVLEGQSGGDVDEFVCVDLDEGHWANELIYGLIAVDSYFVFDLEGVVNMSLETGFEIADTAHTCRPNDSMTRAEFTALLVYIYHRAEFEAFAEAGSFDHPYVDLDAEHVYFEEVAFATKKGIVEGVKQADPGMKNGVFAADQVIKRSEALKVALLSQGKFSRTNKQKRTIADEYLYDVLDTLYTGDKEYYVFTDVFIDEIYTGAWYRDILEYSIAMRIIEGRMIDMGNGVVERRSAMTDAVTIAEAAKILKTVMDHTSPFEVVAE